MLEENYLVSPELLHVQFFSTCDKDSLILCYVQFDLNPEGEVKIQLN